MVLTPSGFNTNCYKNMVLTPLVSTQIDYWKYHYVVLARDIMQTLLEYSQIPSLWCKQLLNM